MPPSQPRSLGELFNAVFDCYRRSWKLLVGVMALPQVALFLLGLAFVSRMRGMIVPAMPGSPPQFNIAFLALLFPMIFVQQAIVILAFSAEVCAVTAVHAQRPASFLGCYREVWRRLGPIAGLAALFFALLVGGGMIVITPLMVVSFAIGFFISFSSMGGGPAAVILIGIVVIIALFAYFALACYFGSRLSLSYPALIVENVGPVKALGRSFSLTKGFVLRLLALGVLVWLVVVGAVVVVQGPFYIVNLARGGAIGAMPFWLQAPMLAVSAVVNAFVQPMMPAAFAIAYFDIRGRKEGPDIDRAVQAPPQVEPTQAPDSPPSPLPA